MQKLRLLRLGLYSGFMLLMSAVPLVAALLLAHQQAYFGSDYNFSVQHVRTTDSPDEVNRALVRYLDQHDLVLARRVYELEGHDTTTKTYLFGHTQQPTPGVTDANVTTNETLVQGNLLGRYAVFGSGKADAFHQYLQKLGLDVRTTNPNDPKTLVMDTVSLVQRYHFDYLFGFLVALIILLNGYIAFKSTKAVALNQLFQGRSSVQEFGNQVLRSLRGYVGAYLVVMVGLWGSGQLFWPDLIKLALVTSTTLAVLYFFPLFLASVVCQIVLQRSRLVGRLKGKGRTQSIAGLASFLLMIIFMLTGTVLTLNDQAQQSLKNLQTMRKQWQKIAPFSTLDFGQLDDESDDYGQGLSLMRLVPESDLLLTRIQTESDQPEGKKELLVNPTYFNEQKIYRKNGQRLQPSDFKRPFTLLTVGRVNENHVAEAFTGYLMVPRQQLQVVEMQPPNVYAYQADATIDQTSGFQQSDQILVINLHALMALPRQQLPANGIVQEQVLAWASQRALLVNPTHHPKLKDDLAKLLPGLQAVTPTTAIQAQLTQELSFNQHVLRLNLLLALVVMLLAGYLMTNLNLLLYQKELFIQRIYGQSFWQRYARHYLLLLLMLLPGLLAVHDAAPVVMQAMLGLAVCLIGLYTLQVVYSTHQRYQVLKGAL